MTAGIEEVKGAIDVGGEVEFGRLDRGPHPGAGCEVDDCVKVTFCKGALNEDGVTNISLDNGDLILKAGNIKPLDLGAVVVVKVVDDGDLMSLCEKSLDKMGTDESSSSRDKIVHGKG